MTCSYCRYLNSDEERRCRRCGRPISDSFAIATTGSLATVPQVRTEPVGPPAVAPPPPVARRMAAPRQALLFPEKPTGKIIPFEALSTPLFEQPAPKPKSAPRTQSKTQPKRAARTNAAQPSLDFLPPAPPETRRLGTSVEAVIYCDAPVAAPMHRVCAALIDASMIVIACGLFFTTFHMLGGTFSSNKIMWLMLAASSVLIAMFYGFLSVWSGGVTIGMQATHLSLINFDGYPPDRVSRWLRFIGECLSFSACGLGILWALVDEESLAWHDHISKTFPTFRAPESNFVRQ